MLLLTVPASAHAQQRTPAQATQHALDERANCYAQRRPECPTATPARSAIPSATPTLAPTSAPSPTETPLPTATPEPCWQHDPEDADYLLLDDNQQPIPCVPDDVVADNVAALDQAVSAEPTPTATPTPVPTPTAPTRLAPAAAPQVQQVVVERTVVVVVTAPPASFAPIGAKLAPTEPVVVYVPQPQPTPTTAPSVTPTPTTSTAAQVTPTPVLLVASTDLVPGPDRRPLYVSVVAAFVVASIAAGWLFRRGRRAYAP